MLITNSPPPYSQRGWGIEVISYRLVQNSALLLEPEQALPPVLEPLPEQVLLPVPRPLPGLLSVSEPLPEPLPELVSVSACSLEQQDQPYILSH